MKYALFILVLVTVGLYILLQPTPVKSDVEPEYLPPTPEEVALDDLMWRIGDCESDNIPTARNPLSSAKGRFQFLDGTWRYYGDMLWGTTTSKSVFSYTDNTELARFVLTNYGTGDWNASIHCWGI